MSEGSKDQNKKQFSPADEDWAELYTDLNIAHGDQPPVKSCRIVKPCE